MEAHEVEIYKIEKVTKLGLRNASRTRLLKYLTAWGIPHSSLEPSISLRKKVFDAFAEYETRRLEGQAQVSKV